MRLPLQILSISRSLWPRINCHQRRELTWRYIRTSSCTLQESAGESERSDSFLKDSYHCTEAWNKRLETPILQKIVLEDFFYDVDTRYQADKVISAVDVDVFVNKVTNEESLEEAEELVHRLRKSPATADTLPSTSYGLIRALLNVGRLDDIMRILNDRWNYGVFIDYHLANILMDEFLKQGNNRDAAKIASLLMLEEDFGPATSRYFAILSCLRYLRNPTPEPWDTSPPKEESDEEVKVRLHYIRNPYFDDHFDLTDPNHIIGKTLSLVSHEIKEDETLARSSKLLGLALHEKWNEVEAMLKELVKSKKTVTEEVFTKTLELCDAAQAIVDASPNKKLPKPKVHQFPGVNLDEKYLNKMWDLIDPPPYEKFLPSVKTLLTSNQVSVVKDFDMVKKTEELLSSAINERSDAEIKAQLKVFKEWGEQRILELDNQMKRFRKFEVMESVEARKKDLQEKEEVIFFFDNEEEWMMRLPPEEQHGYRLPTNYEPQNWTKFVRSIPPKKVKVKKKKEQ